MNALQTSTLPLQPVESPRSSPRAHRRQRRQVYWALTIETTAKLAVSITLSAAAIAALVRILPYHLSQQAKLQEIRFEVKLTEARVTRLRADFSQYFDPQQTKSVMQQQSYRIDPKQRQIKWLDNPQTPEASSRLP